MSGVTGSGIRALGIYGVVATLQSDDNFGRVLAAYGGILWLVRSPGA